ncbi:zinc finger and BTB domain-containing protein 22-like isoform X1 [Gouania willdenowi]|uniref:zinc finger and BTB domain-containing protein 22-like isoform X1 n=1 Tax=Gouania willdenowi TaxID=441366 RepID=UPI001056BE75|nr:zinc finger and BTB domain-containing protein 22-like isoform X1 [Gouania willdenowi]
MEPQPVEVGISSSTSSVVHVSFPSAQTSVLDSLNQQRENGRLCDLSIHVQDRVFKAHRCVLAASSPYFHDQVLLKNMSTVSIPALMDPLAFEGVLSCAYTGQLSMLRDDIVNYLTVGSVLQMWHIVDKCTELLKEGRAAAAGGGGGVRGGGADGGSTNPSSSNADVPAGGDGGAAPPVDPRVAPPPPGRLVSESQSPSSTNYFSPRHGNGFSGSASTAASADGGGGNGNTPSYCTPSGGEEAFLIEEEEEEGEDEEEEEEEEGLYRQRKRGGGGGGGGGGSWKRKKRSSASEQEVGVSDSFGVSSYQDGQDLAPPPQKRPTYSQPSIMPRKQWVVVKTEHSQDDDLIVVSGEEGEDEEEEEDEDGEMERVRTREERDGFNISNVRSLSDADVDSQDFCQSSEDYLKYEGSLMEQTMTQHFQENPGGTRAVSSLLGQVQVQPRAQLLPLDMQGNQILLYSQGAGLSLEAPPPPLGMMGGASFKGPGLDHGSVHLSGSEGGDGVGGASGKVFMCHCGKTFTHKSMRDRHINMHLDLRPFHCPVCAKKFKMKHHLTEHMKTHTGLKPYDCLSCGKKFMWRDSFMRHRSNCERREGGGGGEEPGSAMFGSAGLGRSTGDHDGRGDESSVT